MTATASTGAGSPALELRTVTLAGAVDFAGFRRACRQLWAEQVAPERVNWRSSDDAEGDLFDADPARPTLAGAAATSVPPVNAPRRSCRSAKASSCTATPSASACSIACSGGSRSSPACAHDPLDPDWLRADEMAQAVRRDMHKMNAFVRFRTIADDGDGAPLTSPGSSPSITSSRPPRRSSRAASPPCAGRS